MIISLSLDFTNPLLDPLEFGGRCFDIKLGQNIQGHQYYLFVRYRSPEGITQVNPFLDTALPAIEQSQCKFIFGALGFPAYFLEERFGS